MVYVIADSFGQSLARLTADEQRAAKTTAFDLQMDPSGASMSFHRLDKARDKRFWSVRVSSDLRVIVHRTDESVMLCYVDHHNEAYRWAERRVLENHPTTGAAQFVEVAEQRREVEVPVYVPAPRAAPRRMAIPPDVTDAELMAHGVPVAWLSSLREADEDEILEIAIRLPAEAAEAVLQFSSGVRPEPLQPEPGQGGAGFDHPDARRRFRVVADHKELEAALEAAWDRWIVFLHPAQRACVERTYSGPARVSGSAGTGKTVVALHRAAHLASARDDARVLLTTFSEALANALRDQLGRLLARQPRVSERIEVLPLDAAADRLYRQIAGGARVISDAELENLCREAVAAAPECTFPGSFVLTEWQEVVDAQHIRHWDAYRTAPRQGRRSRLTEAQRRSCWAVFERLNSALDAGGCVTRAGLYGALQHHYKGTMPPYDHIVVDEAQDVSAAQLRFLAALGSSRPDGLFFTGDLGQRIFQRPFSWVAQGVEVRGRSRTLKVNYRTSHQIRTAADRLLQSEISDVDGNTEGRKGAVSLFEGPPPRVEVFADEGAERDAGAEWLAGRLKSGVEAGEVGIFVRTEAQVHRASAVAGQARLPYALLDERMARQEGRTSIGTMHLAKGLEFRCVLVMACDEDTLPLGTRLEAASDDADLRDAYDTERQLLYVACTRARDELMVTGVYPASEFLADMG
ncbi:MAG: UvrD-helicase domain-containing protein [Armatimonadetes bacterium]|nr:UvrD-helicase domain-containing protein [Armatimonadota bacterium]